MKAALRWIVTVFIRVAMGVMLEDNRRNFRGTSVMVRNAEDVRRSAHTFCRTSAHNLKKLFLNEHFLHTCVISTESCVWQEKTLFENWLCSSADDSKMATGSTSSSVEPEKEIQSVCQRPAHWPHFLPLQLKGVTTPLPSEVKYMFTICYIYSSLLDFNFDGATGRFSNCAPADFRGVMRCSRSTCYAFHRPESVHEVGNVIYVGSCVQFVLFLKLEEMICPTLMFHHCSV